MTTEEDQQARQDAAKDDVDIEGTVMKILGKQEPDEAVGMLLKDNYKQRDKMRRQSDRIKALETEKEALETKETPDNTEELAKLAVWQELGTIEEVKDRLGKLSNLEHDQDIQSVAEAAEMNWEVLKDLDRLNPDIVLSLKDGKPVVEQGDTVTDLNDYAEANWASYTPSLKKNKGTTYIQQTSSGSGSRGTDLVGSFLQAQEEKKEKTPSRLKMGS